MKIGQTSAVTQSQNGEDALSHRLLLVGPDMARALLDHLVRTTHRRRARIADLADTTTHDDEELLELLSALDLLGFIEVRADSLELTPKGLVYAAAPVHERKAIIANQFIRHVPLAAYVLEIFERRPDRALSLKQIEAHLGARFSPTRTPWTLRQTIDWGRYLGIFLRDETGRISMARLGTALREFRSG
jgi:hypothetical protein